LLAKYKTGLTVIVVLGNVVACTIKGVLATEPLEYKLASLMTYDGVERKIRYLQQLVVNEVIGFCATDKSVVVPSIACRMQYTLYEVKAVN